MKRTIQGTIQRVARMARQAARLSASEQGGEIIEYALIAGLISIVAIALIASIGTKVLARWTTINGSM